MTYPEIHVRYDPETNRWFLLQDVAIAVPYWGAFVVPAGFRTDFASVPGWLWGLFPPIGTHNLAALVHDYLYVQQVGWMRHGHRTARYRADRVFLALMLHFCPRRRLRSYLMYYAVRWFGAGRWHAT